MNNKKTTRLIGHETAPPPKPIPAAEAAAIRTPGSVFLRALHLLCRWIGTTTRMKVIGALRGGGILMQVTSCHWILWHVAKAG